MKLPHFPASWSPRLRAGAALIALLAGASTAGPWLAADPNDIVDPRHSSLLPPGSVRTRLTTVEGETVVADAVTESNGRLIAVRGSERSAFDRAAVRSVERRVHLFGTDALGRDVLARLLHGGRVSLLVGSAALILALCLGVAVGLAAGWTGGVVDALLMRLVDGLLAVPMVFLLLLLAAVFRPSLVTLVLILAFSAWMGVARLVRGQVLSLKEREFILAARGIGASPLRIAVTHLLPNALTPLAQDAALRLGDLILVEASLSFLGLGVPPPHPSWGSMVAEGQDLLMQAWWLSLIPGAAVALTVIAAALLADGISEMARTPART